MFYNPENVTTTYFRTEANINIGCFIIAIQMFIVKKKEKANINIGCFIMF